MSISFRNISIDAGGKHPVVETYISGHGFAAWPELNSFLFLKGETFAFCFHLHYPPLLLTPYLEQVLVLIWWQDKLNHLITMAKTPNFAEKKK